MDGQTALPTLVDRMGGLADMVFIDGSHDYEDVKRDILSFREIVRPGGLLCGHDVGWAGVDKAISELLPGWQQAPRSCVWYVTV